ncbi:MAG: pyruvate kinase [Planctomycetes bacterium]|nr:pyruvate kinase [Planctomycetota bacterium]
MSTRLTKIVATLGPSSQTPSVVQALVEAGLDIARLNFSHGDARGHARLAAVVRSAARKVGRTVAVLQDLQGPRIRIGALPAEWCDGTGAFRLEEGQTIRLGGAVATRDRRSGITLPTTFPALARDVRRGERLLLRDGRVEVVVEAVRDGVIRALVRRGGDIRSRSGINAPDSRLDVPALTAKDRVDLAVGARLGVDAVALSFVRDAADVERARRELARLGSRAMVVAKIERREAIEQLDALLGAADGVMVARGDLGVELGPEAVPLLQKEILRKALARHSFAITATQMLESMVESATPTRAEVSDVANAILDGTDALMLSGETANGRHPVAAVAAMDRIARHVERGTQIAVPAEPPPGAPADDFIFALAGAAVQLAEQSGARALLPFTESGRTAAIVATYRPELPIIALTPHPATARRLAFWRGVTARLLPRHRDLARLFAAGVRRACAAGDLARGDVAVLVGGHALAPGGSNTLQVVRVGGTAGRSTVAG